MYFHTSIFISQLNKKGPFTLSPKSNIYKNSILTTELKIAFIIAQKEIM